ncbi:hypothetical protein BDP27DRAFT_1429803 [Rhodocollybia butyracea]|uniref:Uncharacterized protein n=1 Tax=Rhodocollybia butyracea TaxID=206335 RepID=A0A9P5TZC1_9AGAR|nr:hypothetical protein BDP27DRAFT_1429803 [Rhodocollybia butyracea]
MFLITTIFIGTFLEVLVYGAYVATFIRHVQILVLRWRKLPPKTFIYLSTASFLLFVIATVAIVGDLVFTASVFKSPIEPIDLSGYDAFLLYRSYIIYNSRLCVVALPLMVFVIECGIGIWSIISLSQKSNVDPWADHPPNLTLAETVFGFISGAVNVMCTKSKGLIIACMWRSHHQLLAAGIAPNLQPSAYVQVGAIIINSAAINLIWWLCVFVTSIISSLMYEVFAAPFSCVTALIFSTIIVSASRPSSKSSALVSFPPLGFPHDSMPSNLLMGLSADNMLEAGIQPAEVSSQERSNNGVSPNEE